MDEILLLAKKHNIKIIEDNAESLGGYYKNKILGSIGDLATLSFFGNKIITTGEGGAVITNNTNLYKKCLLMRDHGMSTKEKYKFIQLGFNYRMTNLQASVGISQMNEIKKILRIRRKQMERYYYLLSDNNNFTLREFEDWCQPSHWLMTIILKRQIDRNKLIAFLYKNGVEARPMVPPVFNATHLKKYYIKSSNAEEISKKSLHLPSSTGLTNNQIDNICNLVKKFF